MILMNVQSREVNGPYLDVHVHALYVFQLFTATVVDLQVRLSQMNKLTCTCRYFIFRVGEEVVINVRESEHHSGARMCILVQSSARLQLIWGVSSYLDCHLSLCLHVIN